MLLVEDPKQFARSRDVGAYFGLVPRHDESSDSSPQLQITKAGMIWDIGCWSVPSATSWGRSGLTAICAVMANGSHNAEARTPRSGRP